ncbi:MAG: hypothetical protein KatS3mg031_2267 [Chitinophagales bacterium]|nr:MAG: hypothetical protein KatS3mg031_2267 [Chitinophagales bacterium]
MHALLIIAVLVAGLYGFLSGQVTIHMTDGTTDVCEGTLLDSEDGQLAGHYDNNENYVFSICVPAASAIVLSFNSFCTEYLFDTLSIFDGPGITSPRIGGPYSGDPLTNPGGMPGTVVATSGCMTLHFVSDGSVTCEGWSATWEVVIDEPQEPNFLPIPNPPCFSNTLTVTLDQQVPCDSVYPQAFSLTGPNAPTVTAATALNCSGGTTSSIQLTFSHALNRSGTYGLVFTSYFVDVCGELWVLTAQGSFIVNDCPLDAEIQSSEEVICPGDCVQLEATVTGGVAGTYTYSWSPGLPATAGPHRVCPMTTTTYTVTVDDAGPAASDVATKTITVLSAPVITNPTTDTTICRNTVIFLTAMPPGGVWQGDGMVNTDTVTGRFRGFNTTVGPHMVTYTAPVTGCRDSVVINVIQFNAGPTQAACPGASPFQVSNPAPPGGYWVGPFIDSSGVFNPSTPGQYDVTYYAPNGCSGTKRINVATISVQATDTVCSTFQPYYTLGFSPAGGVWSGSGIIHATLGRFDPRVAGPGWHTLTYTILGGCSASVDLFVQNVSAGSDRAACPQQAPFLLPSANPPGGTWSGTGIANAATGLYDPSRGGGDFDDVLIYTYAGCTDTLVMYVRQTKIFPDTIRMCEYNSPIKLDFVQPWSGTWSGPGIVVSSYPGYFDPLVAGPGMHTIYYTDNTCTDSMVVVVHQTPVIQPVSGLCELSAPINLSASPAGGIWFHYMGNAITDPIAGTFNPAIAGAGDHAVVYVTLPDSCFNFYVLHVDSLVDVVMQDIDSYYCYRDTLIRLTATPAGGLFAGSGVADSFFNPAAAGPGLHTITYTYGSGECAVEDQITTRVGDSIVATVNFSDTTICFDAFVNLAVYAEGGNGKAFTFTWNAGLQPGQFQSVSPETTTVYSVTVADGCSDPIVRQISVSVEPEITVTAVTNTRLCYGDEGFASLTVLPVDSYAFAWYTTPVVTSKDLIAPAGRTYTVRITSMTTGCSVEEQVELPGYNPVRVFFAKNPAHGCITQQNPFYTFIDLSEGVTSGIWDFGDGQSRPYSFGENPVHEYADTGLYLVTLIGQNEGNCQDTFQMEVCVEQQPVIFAPASFTPNGDGVNDEYRVRTFGLTYFEMYIFNRWGEQIFESRDPQKGWDGYYHDEPVPAGGYPYIIYYKGTRSKAMEVQKGMIVVLR